jgi:class 3 adenylate cyclase/tetratricopeptide (TPR) repeat protein
MREERKVVTALFADLVGSTALGERLDPEDVREVVGGAIAAMIEVVEALGGTVKDLAGDGMLALFGAPVAHEDDAERAILAGLRIVERIGSYSTEVARTVDVGGLGVRVGVQTGLVVLGPVGAGGRVEYGATGDALNTAARLQSHAEPGTVLVGEEAYRATAPRFTWGDELDLELKGKAEPVSARRPLGRSVARGSARALEGVATPLIGREEELRTSLEVLDGVIAGRGGVLFVVGPPGIGKSRLLAELRARCTAELGPRAPWLEGRCVSYGEALPYGPFRDLLRTWLGMGPEDPDGSVRVALEERLAAIPLDGQSSDGSDPRAYLAGLMGLRPSAAEAAELADLSPEAVQFRAFEAFCSLLIGLAEAGPIALVVEDIHWADPTSIRLTRRLAEAAASHPIMLVATGRPEPDHDSAGLVAEVGARHPGRCRVVALDALAPGEDHRLLESLVGAGTLPSELARSVLGTAEGNPFFLEELVRSLRDAGALVGGDDGWRFVPVGPVEVPSTVERVILARVDRLEPPPREALDAASVLGREFDQPLLQVVLGANGALPRWLSGLVRVDLIEPLTERERRAFRFAHALIQETVLGALLRRRRRELHRRAAEAIERLWPDRVEQNAAVLAMHLRGAGDPEGALPHLWTAADAARRTYAVKEALTHLSGALEVCGELGRPEGDPMVGDLLLARGQIRSQTGDAEGARADLEAALAGARRAGDRAREGAALSELGYALAGAADYRAAVPMLERALVIAEERGVTDDRVLVLARLAILSANDLRLDRALEHADAAMALAAQTGDERLEARALDAMKQITMELGDLDGLERVAARLEAIHRRQGDLWYLQFVVFERAYGWMARARWSDAVAGMQEALALNRRIEDRGNEPLYLSSLSRVHRCSGSYGRALELARSAVSLARDLGHAEWIAWSEIQLGAVLLEILRPEEAVPEFERGLAAAEQAGARLHLPRLLGLLALGHGLAGTGWRDPLSRALEVLAEVRVPAGSALLGDGDAYVAAAWSLVLDGRPGDGRRIVEPILEAAGRSGWLEHVAWSALVVAWCHLAEGDPGAARRGAERALAVAEQARMPAPAWRARATLARLASSPGEVAAHRAAAEDVVTRLSQTLVDASMRRGFVERALAEVSGEGGVP